MLTDRARRRRDEDGQEEAWRDTRRQLQGTGWEIVSTGVKSLTFQYFQNTGGPLALPLSQADKALVRAVEAEVSMERKIPGTTRTLKQTVRRRYFLPGRETR